MFIFCDRIGMQGCVRFTLEPPSRWLVRRTLDGFRAICCCLRAENETNSSKALEYGKIEIDFLSVKSHK